MNLFSLNDVIATSIGTLCRDTINNNAHGHYHRHSVHDNLYRDNDKETGNVVIVEYNEL